jgi:pimeloyl-ACP methyl ester carboxylesterase/GNAT superfamily N-acetyltransferase
MSSSVTAASDYFNPTQYSIKQNHIEEAKKARGGLGSEYKVQTVAGKISVWDSQTKFANSLIFIHGNSACKEVFVPLYHSLSDEQRIIAIDLPGHGESDDAAEPDKHYNLNTFSQVIQEVVQSLELPNYYIIGWSLGGHVAIEALKDQRLKGIIISGTPPIEMSPAGFQKGFYETMKMEYLSGELKDEGSPKLLSLLMKETGLEKREAMLFHAYGGMDTLHDEKLSFLVSAGQRTDGLARKYTLKSFFNGGNQAETVTKSDKPILAIQGETDAEINNAYIKDLLKERYVQLAGGHGLIYTNAEAVSRVIKEFLQTAAVAKINRENNLAIQFQIGVPSHDFFSKAWASEPLTGILKETNISYALPMPDENISLLAKKDDQIIGQCSTNKALKYWSHLEKINVDDQNLSTRIFINIHKKAVALERAYLNQMGEAPETAYHNAGIAVLPEYRGHKLGIQLVEQQITLCRQNNIKFLFCETTNHFSAAIMENYKFTLIAQHRYSELGEELQHSNLSNLDDCFTIWCLKM